MRRKPSGADGRSPAELIARITAENRAGAGSTGRSAHRRTGARHRFTASTDTASTDTATVVTRDLDDRDHSLGSRLAPLAVGAVVTVLATVVATTVRPEVGPPGPVETELSAVQIDSPAAPPEAPSAATAPPPVESSAAAPAPEPPAPEPVVPLPDEPVRTPPVWTAAGGDEFTDGLDAAWTVLDQDGHSRDTVTVADGVLTLRGDETGRTGAVVWTEGSRFGRWEMRARFPAGDPRYQPVLLLRPTEGEAGEIDFVETSSSSDTVRFAMHGGDDELRSERTLDTTEWHDYAVEWTDDRVTGFIDGQKWFESTDPGTLPQGDMQTVVQLDWVPDAHPTTGLATPTEMQVDHLLISS